MKWNNDELVLKKSTERNAVMRLFDKKNWAVRYNDVVCPALMALTKKGILSCWVDDD